MLDQLQQHLRAARDHRSSGALASTGQRAAVRAFQAARLRTTYSDLLAIPRYTSAAEFFLTDLYSTADQSLRDMQLERALPKLVRYLPAGTLEPIGLALEMDALAERLDSALARQLFGPSEPSEPIAADDYARAYRASANQAERAHQIDLVESIGSTLDRIARKPGVATAVALMRGPARAAGFDQLQTFLERGLAAFKQMKGADGFLLSVIGRERAINDRLFAAETHPFRLDPRQFRTPV